MDRRTLTLLLAVAVPLRAQPTRTFEVSCEDAPGNSKACIVAFYRKLPRPAVVDRIVRGAMEVAVLADPTTDISMSAVLGNANLTPNQYSGGLIYTAVLRRIMSLDAARGVKSSVSETRSYYVLVEERQTLTPKDPVRTPVRKWLTLRIVYPRAPKRDEAYAAMLAEIEQRVDRRLDIDAYVDVGDKNIKTSWHQVKDTDGTFMSADYSASSRTASHNGRILKRFR